MPPSYTCQRRCSPLWFSAFLTCLQTVPGTPVSGSRPPFGRASGSTPRPLLILPFCSQRAHCPGCPGRGQLGTRGLAAERINSGAGQSRPWVIAFPASASPSSCIASEPVPPFISAWTGRAVKLLGRLLLALCLVQTKFRILILLFISPQIIGEQEHYILREASVCSSDISEDFHLIRLETQETLGQ